MKRVPRGISEIRELTDEKLTAMTRAMARESLFARLSTQLVTGIRDWTRDELYD